ncbi:cupredoxin domain-containing protein [Rhodohalobacter halophilus]|uniref:cupredoxin domain-containing protein n=1 Tax=Rhodohalobacter halophilus TaxID=1812810 RepID=UPI00083F5545|nr:plastocyanin/azurin family copper-binding protein [Rhodohalobacter halophilus]
MRWIIFHIALMFLTSNEVNAQQIQPTETDTVTIRIVGSMADSRFVPAEIEIRKGDLLKFIVEEGVHTVTAYHPDNRRPIGIPEEAESFDSDILQKGEVWFYQPNVAGEYNYFCRPHERMGHKGKFIVR